MPVCGAYGANIPYALWQFGEMIQCAQPGVNPFLYNEYGCWCGLGGYGEPKDDIDVYVHTAFTAPVIQKLCTVCWICQYYKCDLTLRASLEALQKLSVKWHQK